MIVCICRGASDRRIASVIEDGARSIRDLQRCGIGDQCGGCHNMLRKMLATAADDRAAMAAAGLADPKAASDAAALRTQNALP